MDIHVFSASLLTMHTPNNLHSITYQNVVEMNKKNCILNVYFAFLNKEMFFYGRESYMPKVNKLEDLINLPKKRTHQLFFTTMLSACIVKLIAATEKIEIQSHMVLYFLKTNRKDAVPPRTSKKVIEHAYSEL